MEKMVKLKLFKDNGQYKDDVFVAVNGRTFQIVRGVEVEVPAWRRCWSIPRPRTGAPRS